MAVPYARGVLRRGEDEPLPHPHQAADRARGAGRPVPGASDRPGGQAGTGAAAAAAVAARRHRCPGNRTEAPPFRDPGGGGAAPRLLVDRPGPRDPGAAQRGAVLVGPARPADRAAVAYGRVRVPAEARGSCEAPAALRATEL